MSGRVEGGVDYKWVVTTTTRGDVKLMITTGVRDEDNDDDERG